MTNAQPILVRGRDLLPRPATGQAGDVVLLGGDGRAVYATPRYAQWSAPNQSGATIGGQRVVTLDPATGGMVLADSTTPAHAGRPLGLTTGAIEDGALGVAQQSGPMTDVSWAWTPGVELFLGASGLLVPYASLPAGRAFDRRLAVARTATSIILEILEPIVR